MRELLGAVITFITVAVVVMIGGAMISVTNNVTVGLVGGNATNTTPGWVLMNTLQTNTGNALTTLTSLLPILALAIVGGLAIFYLLGFLGRGMA